MLSPEAGEPGIRRKHERQGGRNENGYIEKTVGVLKKSKREPKASLCDRPCTEDLTRARVCKAHMGLSPVSAPVSRRGRATTATATKAAPATTAPAWTCSYRLTALVELLEDFLNAGKVTTDSGVAVSLFAGQQAADSGYKFVQTPLSLLFRLKDSGVHSFFPLRGQP